MRTLTALLFAALTALATNAGASPHRIAVIEPEEALVRALTLSLSPWDVETTSSDARPPDLSRSDGVETASQLARRLRVEAVIWISHTEEATLLWVFDARTGNVTARMLAEAPPFDAAAAASVALSVKTVLRTSSIAPPAERFGADRPPPQAHHAAALELGGAGHWISERALEVRFELAGVAWLLWDRRIGVGLELSAGPGVSVADERFRGRYREIVAGGEVRLGLIRESGFSAAVSLGGAVQWTRLDGTLTQTSLDRDVTRLGATLDAEALMSVELGGGAYFGIAGGVAYSPASRRYLVEGHPVLAPWSFSPSVTGHVGVGLF